MALWSVAISSCACLIIHLFHWFFLANKWSSVVVCYLVSTNIHLLGIHLHVSMLLTDLYIWCYYKYFSILHCITVVYMHNLILWLTACFLDMVHVCLVCKLSHNFPCHSYCAWHHKQGICHYCLFFPQCPKVILCLTCTLFFAQVVYFHIFFLFCLVNGLCLLRLSSSFQYGLVYLYCICL